MPIDPEAQRYRVPTGEESLAGLRELVGDPESLPLSPLSAPTAIGMQAIGRAGGRPLRDLVLQANALLERYAPMWAEKVKKVPVLFDEALASRGLHKFPPSEISLGPSIWKDPMNAVAGELRPLSTLIHEAAHARLAGPGTAIPHLPTPLAQELSSARTGLPLRQRPSGLSKSFYPIHGIPDEVLADAMRGRLFRRAFPSMGPTEATIAHAFEPSRAIGWLKESDAPALKDLLDYLVR